MLELLEHDQRARLAHHEAVPPGVERPRRALGVVVSPRQRAHRAEARDADLVDRRLGPAAQHHVRPAEPDLVDTVADRHVRRRARRALRRQRALRAQLHRDPAGAHVGDDRGDRERVDPVRAACDQCVVAVLVGLEPADPGRDRRSDAVLLLRDLDPGVRLRLPRGGDDQLREAVHAPRLLALDPHGGIEVLQLARELHRVDTCVEVRDRACPRLAGEQVRPRRRDVVAERRDHAQPGDHDASSPVERTVVHSYIPMPPSTSNTSPVMNEASSEQRKRTAPATSAGSPRRPSGVDWSIAPVASSGRTSVSRVLT